MGEVVSDPGNPIKRGDKARVLVGLTLLSLTLGCARGETRARFGGEAPGDEEQATAVVPTTSDPDATPSATRQCSAPPCSGAGALPQYEPELASRPPEMSAAEATRLLGALTAPRDAECARLRKPITQTCDSTEDDVVGLVTSLREARSLKERWSGTEALSRLEGCAAFPKGALRWLQIHELCRCAVELAEPVLQRGGPDLDPALRGLLVGEVIGQECLRRVEAPPPLGGKYTRDRFQRWHSQSIRPWQERMIKRLAVCHDMASSFPVGAPGRAAALIGYAQAVAKFATALRAAPLTKAMQQDYELRTAYYTALDAVTADYGALRQAASDEARREAACEGDYDRYARAFASLVVRREPFSVLGLPPLPGFGETPLLSVLAHLPTQISSLHPGLSPFSLDRDGQQALAAMLRRGLPQTVRARLGAQLTALPTDDNLRQRGHGLLAAGLLRLGLVLQDPDTLERAAYEIRYADASAQTAWLGAIARALTSPTGAPGLFRSYAPSPERAEPRALDLSGFTPELSNLAETRPEFAALAVDHSVLATIGPDIDHFLRQTPRALLHARRPGVPMAVTACVNHWLSSCGWGYDHMGRESCDCTPFPWRVVDNKR